MELLRTWNSAGDNARKEAEQRAQEKFVEDLKVISIPLPASMGREEREGMMEVVRMWNSDHSTKCEYLLVDFMLNCAVDPIDSVALLQCFQICMYMQLLNGILGT